MSRHEITAQVGERYRFYTGKWPSDSSMNWIDVEHTADGIKLRGGAALEILPEVSNMVEVKLVGE